MTTLPDFSSVPGQAVPGMVVPGLIQQAGTATLWQYYGHLPLFYLDYLDDSTEETLVAVPGGRYLMTAVNSRAGLSVPPPDGRWVIGGRDFAVYHPPASAAWDRVAHTRRSSVPPVSLVKARAAIGPGPQTLMPVLLQGDVPIVVHPAGSAAWDRAAHFRRPGSVPPVSLSEARAAIGPGPQGPVLLLLQADAPVVIHPPGSAAWDRVAHLRRSSVPPVRLTEARAAIGPGRVPDPPVVSHADIPVVEHPAGSAAWDRDVHFRQPPPVAPWQPSLAEVRVAIEAAKVASGYYLRRVPAPAGG